MRTLRIAGASVNQTPIDWSGNMANVSEAIRKADRERADIICFSELTLTGYGCEDLFLSEWLAATALEKLMEAAAWCGEMTVCLGLPIRWQGQTFNGVAVVQNGTVTGIALKQNLPGDGIHYEPRWFTPWPSGRVEQIEQEGRTIPIGDITFVCKGITFGFEICEDAWRPVRPAANLVRRGVELILNPSASHFAFGKSRVREAIVTDSSRDFGVTYLMVNQLGNEAGKVVYDGDILLASRGSLLLRGPRLSFHPFVVEVAEVDFDEHIELVPDDDEWQDRNTEFAQAASLALFDYLRKSRARGFTLSLSGGADSSCCAVLVAEMVNRASDELGWKMFWQQLGRGGEAITDLRAATGELLTCAYQATSNSSNDTFRSAHTLAESIGARFHHWSVEEEVIGYRRKIEGALGRELSWAVDDIALQNIQARGRSPIIWLLANVTQSILLTTSNRSEGDVGYATMDGDTSGSLAPLAGVTKPFILQWLKWAEQHLGYSGLLQVNALTPTAELRPAERSQTDEADLMPYALLQAIEREAIRNRKSPMQVYETLRTDYSDAGYLRRCVIRFFRMWSANQWKRERLAPSFHFDDMNVDPRSWCRFPILSGGFREELGNLEEIQ